MTDLRQQYLRDVHVQVESLCHVVHMRGETLTLAECRAQLQAMRKILRDTRRAYEDEREAQLVRRWQRLEEAIARYEAEEVAASTPPRLSVRHLLASAALSIVLNGLFLYFF
jgi:hypothetical protein